MVDLGSSSIKKMQLKFEFPPKKDSTPDFTLVCLFLPFHLPFSLPLFHFTPIPIPSSLSSLCHIPFPNWTSPFPFLSSMSHYNQFIILSQKISTLNLPFLVSFSPICYVCILSLWNFTPKMSWHFTPIISQAVTHPSTNIAHPSWTSNITLLEHYHVFQSVSRIYSCNTRSLSFHPLSLSSQLKASGRLHDSNLWAHELTTLLLSRIMDILPSQTMSAGFWASHLCYVSLINILSMRELLIKKMQLNYGLLS